MPKKILYPSRGMDIKEAINLVAILYNNGESLKQESYADLINMVVSGGSFRTKISSLVKYDLVQKKGDEISITDLGVKIMNAYDDREKSELLLKAFTSVPLFETIFETFKDKGLDLKNLDKLLIREFEVNQKSAKLVRDGILNSLDFIGVLNKETGKFNFESNLDQRIESEIDDQSKQNYEYETLIVKPPTESKVNKNILELIKILASNLDPIEISSDLIFKILDGNMSLTHSRIAFEILKADIENRSLRPDNLNLLIKAIYQDLGIK